MKRLGFAAIGIALVAALPACAEKEVSDMQMDQSEVLKDIRSITAEIIEVDQNRIVPEAKWEDFGADRYDFMGILSGVEKRYGIEIPSDDAYDMETVGELMSFVEAARK
jgi:acyl carrier protein